LGASIVSTFLFAMGQSSCVIAKKESWTCERLIGTPVPKKGYMCQCENGDEQFWKEKFHETNRKAQLACTHECPVFFFLKRGQGAFLFSFVPNVYPSCSHGVPKYVHKDVPNCTLVLSHMALPKIHILCI
jgi:hypothetical protein